MGEYPVVPGKLRRGGSGGCAQPVTASTLTPELEATAIPFVRHAPLLVGRAIRKSDPARYGLGLRTGQMKFEPTLDRCRCDVGATSSTSPLYCQLE